jgi:hypothetical protein
MLKALSGVEAVAMADEVPLGDTQPDSNGFTSNTADLSPANPAADALMFNVSPQYFQAAGTMLLLGRPFTWAADKTRPA